MIRRLITRLLPRFAREAVEWRQKCIDGEMVCISHGEFRQDDAACIETVYVGEGGRHVFRQKDPDAMMPENVRIALEAMAKVGDS